jgi:hypothetical protein
MMRFFAHESCGQCTPCRVGTQKAAALMAREDWDTALLAELAQTMRTPRSAASARRRRTRAVGAEVLPARAGGRRVFPSPLRGEGRVRGIDPSRSTAARSRRAKARASCRRPRATASTSRTSVTRRAAPGRQLPRLRGGDRRRAHAGAVVLPRAERRHAGAGAERARRGGAEDGAGAAAADMPEAATRAAATPIPSWDGELLGKEDAPARRASRAAPA